MVEASGVAIILGDSAVANHKQLNKLVECATCPEGVALVAIDLVKRLSDVHASAFEFDMYERQTIDQDSHIVTSSMCSTLLLVLVEHLEVVLVDMFFVD